MPPVKALRIWKKLSESEECREAVDYYDCHYCHKISRSPNTRQKEILKRGAADFDQKYCPYDEGEKARYRTDYYVSGYMDMHLKHNLAAFQHNLVAFQQHFKDKHKHLLLVDFGCGPMTSGLALADILSKSKQITDYKTHTAYFGIDASQNMVKQAEYINKKHKLFEHFKVVQSKKFDSHEIPDYFPEPQIVVLCFSFVLAPNTFKTDCLDEKERKSAAYRLANDWKKYFESLLGHRETLIIYLNPKPENPPNPQENVFDTNWRIFKSKMRSTNQFCYTRKYVPLTVKGLNNISLATIRGTRN